MSGTWIYSALGEYGERIQNKYHKYRYLIPGLPSRDFACRPDNQAITYRTTCLDNTLTLQPYLTGGLLINIGDSEDDNNGDTIYAGLLKTQHNFNLLIDALTATINQIHEAENYPTIVKSSYNKNLWIDIQREDILGDVQVGSWVSTSDSVGSKYILTEPLDIYYSRDTSEYIPIGVVTEMDSLTARIVTHGYVDNVFTNLTPNKTYYIAHSGGTIGLYSDVNESDIYVPVLKSITSTSGIVDIRREYYNLIEGYSREIDISDPDSTLTSIYSECTQCSASNVYVYNNSSPTIPSNRPVCGKLPSPLDINSSLVGKPITGRYYNSTDGAGHYFIKLQYRAYVLKLYEHIKYHPNAKVDGVLDCETVGGVTQILYDTESRSGGLTSSIAYDSGSSGSSLPASIRILDYSDPSIHPTVLYTYTGGDGSIYKHYHLLSNLNKAQRERLVQVVTGRGLHYRSLLSRNGIMYIETDNYYIAFNTSTEKLLWKRDRSFYSLESSRCIINDKIIEFRRAKTSGSYYDAVTRFSYDIHTGLQVNRVHSNGSQRLSSPETISVDNNRNIYFAETRTISIIDSETLLPIRSAEWRDLIESPSWDIEPVGCVCNDICNNAYVVFSSGFGGYLGGIYLVSLTPDLKLRWQWRSSKNNDATRAEIIVGDNNIVYVVTANGYVYAINTETGKEVWSTPESVTGGLRDTSGKLPVVLGENGTLVFAIDRYVYQVQTNSRLCKSSWPMNGANPMYTYCVD